MVVSSTEMTAQEGSKSIDESCVAAPHVQYISHISSWQKLRTTQAPTVGKLPGYIIALRAVWISWVEHCHWPSCQNKSLFPTLFHFHPILSCISFFLSIAGFSFDRDHQLYFDDTCVVPERLEGKTEKSKKKRKSQY